MVPTRVAVGGDCTEFKLFALVLSPLLTWDLRGAF